MREEWEEVIQIQKINKLLFTIMENDPHNSKFYLYNNKDYLKTYQDFLDLEFNILLEIKEKLVLNRLDNLSFTLECVDEFLQPLKDLIYFDEKEDRSITTNKYYFFREFSDWFSTFVCKDNLDLFSDICWGWNQSKINSLVVSFTNGGILKNIENDNGYMGFE